ncbi:MAG: anaerobic ribonucleoside-triphosphate reductase activating protein [Christensenellales bacterium]
MLIHGLNKLTLLDYPGLTACTVFTGGCNFRCPYCHNASLVLDPDSQPVIDEREFFDYLKKREGILEGVCITGGEPTLNPDLLDFIGKIKSLRYCVKLDTNGSNPEMLERLLSERLLDYVAMDVKNSPEKYPETVGVPHLNTEKIIRSAGLIMKLAPDYEFRTTVAAGILEKSDYEKIGIWLRGAKKYFLQVFRDSGDLIDPSQTGADIAELNEAREILSRNVQRAEIRGI